MEIRRAIPDDAAALARVHIESWRSAYRGLVPDSHLANLDYERRALRFRDSLARNAEGTYLVEEDRAVAGFLTLGACRDSDLSHETTGEIWGIYLAPAHWRKGIGTSLCRFGEQLLKTRGYRSAMLWVFSKNDRARRFYEAMGYEPDGATKLLSLGLPLEAVRYWRRLTDVEPRHRHNETPCNADKDSSFV